MESVKGQMKGGVTEVYAGQDPQKLWDASMKILKDAGAENFEIDELGKAMYAEIPNGFFVKGCFLGVWIEGESVRVLSKRRYAHQDLTPLSEANFHKDLKKALGIEVPEKSVGKPGR